MQVGGEIEVVAHLQRAVVADVDRTLRQAALQRGDAGARQVVGVDMVGVDVVRGGEQENDDQHHRHCTFCKSWLFTEVAPQLGFVNVRTTMLDDPSGLEPFVETQTAEKLPWATTPAVHSFERFPEMEKYVSLVEEYALRSTTR